MRRILMLNWISIDGLYTVPEGGIDWVVQDPAVGAVTFGMGHGESDILLMGRVTYQGMESFWPHVANDPNMPEQMRAMANAMNQLKKVVFSTTLPGVTWENTVLHRGDLLNVVKQLKQEGDGDATILIFGSGTLVQPLTDAGLIDDYVLTITPVVLGKGKPLFQDVNKLGLKLVSTQSFASGNVLLHYEKTMN